MPRELAVLKDHRLLRLIEHRGELEIRCELAVDRLHRFGEPRALLGVTRERPREPREGRRESSSEGRGKVSHAPIVARVSCMHPQ